MTVYLDSLILLNFLLDYLLLLLTGRILGAALPRRRIAISSALGALYAAAVFCPALPFLAQPLIRVAVGVLLVLLAYGHQPHLLRAIVLFFALSAALAGELYALSYHNFGITYRSGHFIPLLDLRLILLFAAVSYAIFSLLGRKLARHSPLEFQDVSIYLNGKEVRLRAFLDSGNTLSDPMTGRGVLVAEAAALAPLLPPEADCQHPTECFPRLGPSGRFRLLPYRSVGVDGGLLLAVKVDKICANGMTIPEELVALSPTPVSDNGTYQALLGKE